MHAPARHYQMASCRRRSTCERGSVCHFRHLATLIDIVGVTHPKPPWNEASRVLTIDARSVMNVLD